MHRQPSQAGQGALAQIHPPGHNNVAAVKLPLGQTPGGGQTRASVLILPDWPHTGLGGGGSLAPR